MKDALLEIGLEHLPARFIVSAVSQLQSKAEALLRENRLTTSKISAHGTLRRLALILESVHERSEPLEQVTVGPPSRLLKNERGEFTPQSAGFAKNQGVKPEDLEEVDTPKGKFLQARRVLPGEPAIDVLAKIFSDLIRSLEFPKTMEWESSRLRFARPIRNLLALYGGKTIPFEIAGVHSCNKALGHTPGNLSLKIDDPTGYVDALRKEHILVRMEDRKEALTRSLDQAVAGIEGVRLDKDPDLLEEILCMTEYPTPVVGGFDRAFLQLPRPLLATVLKKQLKFFPVHGSGGGLAPHFVGVRDGASEGQKEVQEGFERVLEARFNDARFFYQRDLRTRLRDKQVQLKGVAFHRDLGSMYEKRERVVESSVWLCACLWRRGISLNLGAVEAIARLAYADLVTDVVREFPELQASMGAHYARHDGESEKVALGIEEFYSPASARAVLPTHLEGAVTALAGKLDTLAGSLLAGIRPTGSEDPFGLRRAGMGIARIVLEKQLPIDLLQAAEKIRALALEKNPHLAKTAPSSVEFERILSEFLWTRVEGLFLERGYSADEIQTVEEGGLRDLSRAFRRLSAVHALRPNPDFATLAAAFKRASNLLKQAGIDAAAHPAVNRSLIAHEAESTLFDAMNRAEKTVLDRISRDDYESGLKRLVELKPCVDHFFENVRVMDASESVKQNRLALLAALVRLFKSVADISRIQSN